MLFSSLCASPKRIYHHSIYLILLPLLFFLSSCSDGKSAVEEIEEYLADVSIQAEKKSLKGLKKHISSGYSDRYGYERKELLRIAAAYFMRTPSINVQHTTSPITLKEEENVATFTVIAAISSEKLELNDLRLSGAQFHRFDVQLVKKKKWLLQSLIWSQSNIEDYSTYLE